MKYVFEPIGWASGWMLEDDKVSIIGKGQKVKKVIPLSNITSFEKITPPVGGVGQVNFWYLEDGKEKYAVNSYKKDQAIVAQIAAEYIKNNYGDGIGKVVWRERRMRCQVCGKVYCFTKDDLDKNAKNARDAMVSNAVSGISAIAGTRMDMYGHAAMAENSASKIVDYSRCPNCHSTNVIELTEEQYKAALNEQNQPKVASQFSGADEIKKYKELLDIGAITQEEFDAKKKQLLGL